MPSSRQQFEDRLEALGAERVSLIEYMRNKLAGEDWHGVADAANDLREIDRELAVLNRVAAS